MTSMEVAISLHRGLFALAAAVTLTALGGIVLAKRRN
jgi:hypothetical protein